MQRAAPPAEPAVPSTPAQHGRRDRILESAAAILAAGGEDALQMKELAQRADVSLATLYRPRCTGTSRPRTTSCWPSR
jgi:AcrR family transcriptional regulator